jgi:hypothetical protein
MFPCGASSFNLSQLFLLHLLHEAKRGKHLDYMERRRRNSPTRHTYASTSVLNEMRLGIGVGASLTIHCESAKSFSSSLCRPRSRKREGITTHPFDSHMYNTWRLPCCHNLSLDLSFAVKPLPIPHQACFSFQCRHMKDMPQPPGTARTRTRFPYLLAIAACFVLYFGSASKQLCLSLAIIGIA